MGKGDVLTIDMNSAAGTNGACGAEVAPLIELRDVVFSYAGHTVVDGVSLQVDRGELDRKSTRLNSSHSAKSRMPSSA